VLAAGLGDHVVVDSAGTGAWHVGHGMDPRARAVLDAAGYPHEHVARRIEPDWLRGETPADLLVAMDTANFADLAAMCRTAGASAPRLRMMRSFDPRLVDLVEPDPRLDVPDPYYGGPAGFGLVLDLIEKAADGLVGGLLGMLRG